MGQTIIEKLWDEHSVADLGDGSHLLYIDRVMFHERTGSIALQGLKASDRKVRNPEQVFGCMDHIVDTIPGRTDATMVPGGTAFITQTRAAAIAAGVNLFDLGDARQGIVHVVSPEQGIAVPGVTLVCPDSHTCTQGALGALAWGIGSTETEHAMATKTLVTRRPKLMRVSFEGRPGTGVTAKDLILNLIGAYTASGGVGYAVEFAGRAVRALPMEARFTLCNMAVEFGAWTGIIAPDDTTYEYSQGRPFAPRDRLWEQALAHWRTLPTDAEAAFDEEIVLDCDEIVPQVTWGTSPQHETGIDGVVPDPAGERDANRRESMVRALGYMDLEPGTPLEGIPIDSAFIGSCTNSRLSDLRNAAAILKGRRVADGIRAICVPGSGQVKRDAEAEGLDRIFTDAGFEWREAGCSMCFFAGGENLGMDKRAVSSTNRNFENRQGPRTRTHLASPTTVAASAVAGNLADVRKLELL
ncbi:MAG: 3-isopropylmalate dehydratase large subunit [Gammaproteobacteria bacterium]